MQIGALIRRAALYYGDAPCLVEGERVVTFGEFDALTDRLGNALIKRGFEAGDRIGVLLPNGIDCLVAYYALAKAGLVRVSLNTRETLADHVYKLSHSASRGVICNDVQGLDVEIAIGSQELAELQRSGSKAPCAVDRDLDAPYRLGFTGGTTGRSKAVTLTMRGELAELSAFLTDLLPEILQGQTFLHAAPIAHASGAFFLPSLVRGARSLIMAKFDPEEFVHLAATEQAELTFLVPTMLAMVLEAPSIEEVRFALRQIAYGASPIAPALLERAEARFGRVLPRPTGRPKARWSSPVFDRRITTGSAPADVPLRLSRSRYSTNRIDRSRLGNVARSSAAGRKRWPTTGTIRRPPRLPSAADGCTRATSATWTTTGSSISSTARTTC